MDRRQPRHLLSGARTTPLSSSRSQSYPAASKTACASARSIAPRNRCETSRPRFHGVWYSSRPACARAAARAPPSARSGRRSSPPGRRHDPVGQPLELAVDHEPAPDLEAVRRRADQPRALEHARPPAPRVEHHLDLRARSTPAAPAHLRERTDPSAPASSEAPGPSSVPSRSTYTQRIAAGDHTGTVATTRETEPWAGLLETGRNDERLVHDDSMRRASAPVSVPAELNPRSAVR